VQGKNVEHLAALYQAITTKMVFTFYPIEEECEIGMTFELMNSRGKGLSVLELLKNYLMHWIFRNVEVSERKSLTDMVNKTWKEVYTNIGSSRGSEDQCLRIAWILYCSHTPKQWKGYQGFKENAYFPLRDFSVKTKAETQNSILNFTDGLAKVSFNYAIITNPSADNTISIDENTWLGKIHRTGNIANFLPLLVAARMNLREDKIKIDDYIELLKSLERYAYRVFLIEGKRSNAGKSNFYRWGNEVFEGKQSLDAVIRGVYGLINYYAEETSFIDKVNKATNWYARRYLLKYTLYEYEQHLLETGGNARKSALSWDDLSDATIEHILPQTPKEGSVWEQEWPDDDIAMYLHDIGNLVLTHNNSNYLNFDFIRKKGKPGISPSYCDSDIRQERKIASFDNWRPTELKQRRSDLAKWISERWKTLDIPVQISVDEDDDADIDSEEAA
jgi:hypothetical protein